MGESPDSETLTLLNKILGLKEIQSNCNNTSKEYFFGRHEELFQVHTSLAHFLDNKSPSIVVSGEAGVGKTTFLKKLAENIDQEKVFYIPYICHYSEKDFYLKSWHNLLKKMMTLLDCYQDISSTDTNASQNTSTQMIQPNYEFPELINGYRVDVNAVAIHDTLMKLTQYKKVVLIIDDIQWLDSASLNLLNMLLFTFAPNKFFVVAAYREDYQEQLNPFIITLEEETYLNRLYLRRFTFDEVTQIVGDLIPNYKTDNDLIRKIYNDTEGNSLFLLELIKIIEEKGYQTLISSKSINIIKSRLIDLAEDEQSVLNALSLFPNKASMADLKIFYSAAELEIFEVLEKLMEKKIIIEKASEGEVFYSFNHQWIREYVQNRQSLGKRKAISEKIARFYEEEYQRTGDKNYYLKMSYHFGECGNVYKSYYYKTEYLNNFYYNYHEIYPHVYLHVTPEIENSEHKYKENSVELETLVNKIEKLPNSTKEYISLRMRVYFIVGRYFLYMGKYQEGLDKINESTRLAIELNDYEYTYKNYKQKIYYSIQIADTKQFKENLQYCKNYFEKMPNSSQEKASILRLNGLYCIEIKQYAEAEKILNETIQLLTAKQANTLEEPNLIDLAVCYSYLGRNCLLQKKVSEAYEYFLKAIELSGQKYITNAVAIFYAEAAEALYEMAQYTEAQSHIKQANYYFSRTHALWGKAKAQIYAALIELKLGKGELAKEYFKEAEKTSIKLCNPILNEEISTLKQKFDIYFN